MKSVAAAPKTSPWRDCTAACDLAVPQAKAHARRAFGGIGTNKKASLGEAGLA
jgi:hypothetical protein